MRNAAVCHESAFEAMAFAFADCSLGRPGRVGVLVFERIDEALNARRRFE